jgi:hypothetical protein
MELLSNVAYKLKLRHYTEGFNALARMYTDVQEPMMNAMAPSAAAPPPMVGRCKLTLVWNPC